VENFTSLQQEIEIKTKKLKKVTFLCSVSIIKNTNSAYYLTLRKLLVYFNIHF
jgi:uncharacterized protein involved in tellurium resistance